jgi:hypothetical protein
MILFAALPVSSLQAADNDVAQRLAGHWEGSARIIVDWCKQPTLPVTIDIHPDGNVTGKIGDAKLTKARLTRNRGWFGRKLNLATDYIIRGDLAGPIVAAESITRSSVSVPLNLAENNLVGGVHTSGTKLGQKSEMILSASSLKLNRTP